MERVDRILSFVLEPRILDVGCTGHVIEVDRSQAVEDLVRDGENGWTFHPDNPEEMYAKINESLNVSSEKLDEMCRKAQQAIQHQTPEYAANQMLEAVKIAMQK